MGKNNKNKWGDFDAVDEHEADHLWEMTSSYKSGYEPDMESAFALFKDKVDGDDSRKPKIRTLPRYSFLRIAAALLFLLGMVAVWKYVMPQSSPLLEMASLDQTKEVLLADGTLVTLNKNSVLKYPEAFEGNKRIVQLEGEAFFKVAKNAKKPFLIYAENTKVRVVGTVFNVRAYANEDFVEVAVKEGKVAFGLKDNRKEIFLTPEEKGTYFIENNTLREEKSGATEWAWNGEERLYFKNANIKEIKSVLERLFGLKITLQGTFDDCTLTANLGQERSVKQVLDAIEGNMNVSIQQKGMGSDISYIITGRCR